MAKWKKLKEDVDIPVTPPLEPQVQMEQLAINTSGASFAIPTASSQGEIRNRLGDLGVDQPRSLPTKRLTPLLRQIRLLTQLRNLPPPHAPAGSGQMSSDRSSSNLPRMDGSHSRVSADSTTANTSSQSSDRRRHLKRSRKMESKRQRRPGALSCSTCDSCRSIHPKGLAHSCQQRPRQVVRHVSIRPARDSYRDKYGAIADRLGAMANKERRESGVAKLGKFTVCASRGFGRYKVDACAGVYGQDPGSALRRPSRADRDC